MKESSVILLLFLVIFSFVDSFRVQHACTYKFCRKSFAMSSLAHSDKYLSLYKEIKIDTQKGISFIDITQELRNFIDSSGVREGVPEYLKGF